MNKLFYLIFSLLFAVQVVLAQDVETNLPYDYSDTNFVSIKMSVLDEIDSKGETHEGQKIKLRVLENVFLNHQIIVKKNTIVLAKVETIITKGMNGFPAEIIIDDFEIENIDSNKLLSTYIKTGSNRCLWVYPLKWALTPIPFVGSLTNFILGGEAYLRAKDVITVKYFPYWK